MIFIAMALPAMILMVQAQRDYEEKMEILYAVLEQQSEGRESVDIVTGLLKGQRLTDAADAEQRLALYGFHTDFANRYKRSLYLDWTVIIAIFLLVSVGFLALLSLTDKRREPAAGVRDCTARQRCGRFVCSSTQGKYVCREGLSA